jgi:DNA-binding MarR family transcriptional regulator
VDLDHICDNDTSYAKHLNPNNWYILKMKEQEQWLEKVHASSINRHDFLASEVRIAYMSMKHVFKKYIDKKIAPTHATLLMLIDEYPNSTQQQLSVIVGLQRSTMVRTIDEFEKKRWVKRNKKEGDRRALAIKITPKGKNIVSRIKPKLIAIEEHIEKTLGEEKRKTMMKTLKEFQDAIWNY